MNSPHPTPILKKSGRDSVSKKLSVTFSQSTSEEQETDAELKEAAAKASTFTGRSSLDSSTQLSGGVQLTPYGLCYIPPAESLPHFSKLHPSIKLTTLKESQRPELVTADEADDHVLILGDVIHGQCLKKELENSSLCDLQVTLAAVPTAENVRRCCFFLILLPLEVIGSCHQVTETVHQLSDLRADFMFCSTVVAVTPSHGCDQHVTELLNLHTFLLQYKLSYYVWPNATPGSWPGILERLAVEFESCRRGAPPTTPGTAIPRGRGVSRAVLSSLLWPRDESSAFLEEYLDVTVHRTNQDLHI